MKANQIEIGKVYAAKVNGSVQPVKILRKREGRISAASGKILPRGWDAINQKTGRKILIRSASRLRWQVLPNRPAIASADF